MDGLSIETANSLPEFIARVAFADGDSGCAGYILCTTKKKIAKIAKSKTLASGPAVPPTSHTGPL